MPRKVAIPCSTVPLTAPLLVDATGALMTPLAFSFQCSRDRKLGTLFLCATHYTPGLVVFREILRVEVCGELSS
jgi:hypothetical protein